MAVVLEPPLEGPVSEAVRVRIGAMLRRLREQRGLTLAQVQELTRKIDWPVSRSRLSLLERGEVEVHLSDLYPLSRTYGFAIGPLVSEAVVAHSRKKFAKGLDSEQLFARAKEYYRVGKPLEAGWAFDEAGRRAPESETDFRHLCMISAGHCYERAEAFELALERVESTIDGADDGSKRLLQALGKAAILRAKVNSQGRALLYLKQINETIPRVRDLHTRAFLLSSAAEVIYLLGDPIESARICRQSARAFAKLNNIDMTAKTLAVASKYTLSQGHRMSRKALKLAEEAASYLHHDTELETQLHVRLALGSALKERGEYAQAEENLRESLRLAIDLSFQEETQKSGDALKEIAVFLSRQRGGGVQEQSPRKRGAPRDEYSSRSGKPRNGDEE